MSLDYNLTAVENRDKSPEGWANTQALIWATLAVDIGRITKDNADEFYARTVIHERIHGAIRVDGQGNGVPITAADVRAHVGLSTNVTTLSRAQWLKRLGRTLDRVRAEYQRDAFALTEATR